MSEQTTQTAGGENQAGTGQAVTENAKTFTQEDVNRLLADQKRKTRDQFGDYDDIKKKLETLTAQEEERKQAEMTELEKAQARIQELTGQVDSLTPFKLEAEAREKAAAEKVEELAKSLTDEQKLILNEIGSGEGKLRYIEQINSAAASKPGLPSGGKPNVNGITQESVMEKRMKGDPSWRDDYAKLRKTK